MHIDLSEGGSASKRQLDKFREYLADNNCSVLLDVSDDGHVKEASLIFSALRTQSSNIKKEYRLLLNGYSSLGDSAQGVILVRDSTDTNDLNSLSGETLAFVGRGARSAYSDLKKLIEGSGLEINQQKVILTGNHVGAVTLLLHKDAFAVGVDQSLAARWANKNALKVIARGPERLIGGFYVTQKQNGLDLKACITAIKQLKRNNKSGKSLMRIFPDWLLGFNHKLE